MVSIDSSPEHLEPMQRSKAPKLAELWAPAPRIEPDDAAEMPLEPPEGRSEESAAKPRANRFSALEQTGSPPDIDSDLFVTRPEISTASDIDPYDWTAEAPTDPGRNNLEQLKQRQPDRERQDETPTKPTSPADPVLPDEVTLPPVQVDETGSGGTESEGASALGKPGGYVVAVREEATFDEAGGVAAQESWPGIASSEVKSAVFRVSSRLLLPALAAGTVIVTGTLLMRRSSGPEEGADQGAPSSSSRDDSRGLGDGARATASPAIASTRSQPTGAGIKTVVGQVRLERLGIEGEARDKARQLEPRFRTFDTAQDELFITLINSGLKVTEAIFQPAIGDGYLRVKDTEARMHLELKLEHDPEWRQVAILALFLGRLLEERKVVLGSVHVTVTEKSEKRSVVMPPDELRRIYREQGTVDAWIKDLQVDAIDSGEPTAPPLP